MRKISPLLVLAAALALPQPAAAGELKLTIRDGLVTLIADNVPLSTVMAEWARIGQTRIVNGDKITTPVSLQIVDTPERRALEILLRSASGYMAAERAVPVAGASVFDRIMILPTSRPPANAPPLQQQSPQPFAPPRPMPMPVQVQDEDEPRPANLPVPNQTQPGQPGTAQPGAAQPGVPNVPQAPLTAPRPGMLPPPPQQPVPFGAPRPGGGGTPTTPAGSGGGGGGTV